MSTSRDECQTMPAEAHSMSLDAATQVAAVLRALAEPLRLRMLSFIATEPTGEACVCDIATVADVAQPTVSHHLKVLKSVGVLVSERRGTWVYYRIAPDLRGAVSTLLDAFAPTVLEIAQATRSSDGLSDVDAVLARIAGQLAARFGSIDSAFVMATVRESYTALARSAGVRAHLVATAERFARQRLEDIARTSQRSAKVPQVLFVCVANAGRSQIAAELVRQYAGDAVIVRSAGSAPASDIHPGVRTVLAAMGSSGDAYPKPLTDDAVRAADVVVTMGCGDTCPVLPGIRYEDWVVGDPALASHDGVMAITAQIDAHVRTLLASLLPDLELPDPR